MRRRYCLLGKKDTIKGDDDDVAGLWAYTVLCARSHPVGESATLQVLGMHKLHTEPPPLLLLLLLPELTITYVSCTCQRCITIDSSLSLSIRPTDPRTCGIGIKTRDEL